MTRRQIIIGTAMTLGGALGVALIAAGPKLMSLFMRSFLPRPIYEPTSVFRIGQLSDFGFGVNTQFQQQYRICVVRNAERLYVIYARCTHMGCSPDWKTSGNFFKCPCHASSFCYGSAFDGDGINCEGPAPRPMDRVYVELDLDGQVVVDVSKLYQWPKDGRSGFDDAGAYIQIRRS
jgi:cytochrome b6-f complex iron-sulfur subunit